VLPDPEASAGTATGLSVAPGVSGPQPAALLYGPAQLIVHGNPPFVAEFGEAVLGLPAAEALLALPPEAFEVFRRVYVRGTPLAAWIEVSGERRRLVAAPRRDVESGEVYGLAIRLAST
jgi:hypothetical protein